jgi:hypothetical protein
MSFLRAIKLCLKQSWRGNCKPWGFLWRNRIAGLWHLRCVRCGKHKGVTTHRNCPACQWILIRKALFKEE